MPEVRRLLAALIWTGPLEPGLVLGVELPIPPDIGPVRVGRSVLSPKTQRPNGLVNLIHLAALLLAVGVVTLGVGLFQA